MVAEGDCSKLATGGTSAATLGTGETDMSKNGSERAVGGSDNSAAEGESSNLAEKSVPDASVSKKRKLEEDTQKSEMSNGDAKKSKTVPDITNADNSVTEEADGKGTGVSGQEAEGKEESFGSMRLAVVFDGFPDDKMTQKQAEVVETALVEKINPTDQGEPIQFSAAEYENGGLVFTCANKTTKSWLLNTVNKLVPWPGTRLTVRHAETTLKGSRFVLRVVTAVHKKSSKQILDWFEKQNKDISTAEWKIIRRVAETDKKERLTLWVDDKSSADLKARNYKLFLGLSQAKFMTMSEWRKQMSGAVNQNNLQLALQSTKRPPVNYVPRRPVVPKFAPHSTPRPLLPGLGSRVVPQSRRPAPSNPNPRPLFPKLHDRVQPQRRGLEFANAGRPRFREAQLAVTDRLSPRAFTQSAVLQNRESRFLASEQLREFGFGTSERTQFRETGYIGPGQAQRREPRYTSDQLEEEGFFAAEHRQPHETVPDSPQLQVIRLMISDEPSPQEMGYLASDRIPSCDSRHLSPKRDQSENLRVRPLLRDFRIGDSDEPPFQVSRFRGSGQMQSREGIFDARDPPYSRESRSRWSNPQQFREFENAVSSVPRSREDRVLGSNIPSQNSRSSYTNSTHSRFSRPLNSRTTKW